ncbi:caspase-1-like [Choloepus didactylus]|uniref:caspase-1-like n=1 Tax=Choloepus didactylus TaxID=27675 RepID=UPI00189E54EB|nr:caspase-1-like [Choloepus didactylus]
MSDKKLKEKRNLFVNSVSEDTLNILLDDLLSERVLSQEETEIVKKKNDTTRNKARVLIDFVICKGSHASQIFISYICQRDFTLASKLGFSSGLHGTLDGSSETASVEPKDTLKLCPRAEFLKRRQDMPAKIYPVKEKEDRTRLALIICNIEFYHLPRRDGANHDILGMKRLLEGLGYCVAVEGKLTAGDMESVLWAFAARPEHKSSDSTFLVFMSHGILDGICGIKHRKESPDVLPYDTIFRIFNNQHCLHLKDKPKVIIIQACRGENPGEVWVSDSPVASEDSSSQSPENLMDDGVHKVHREKDFVAFCSSTPHTLSWRKAEGSLFITQLIICFQKYSWCCPLLEIFSRVQQSFEKPGIKAQMPTIERLSMPRPFYLFPGN